MNALDQLKKSVALQDAKQASERWIAYQRLLRRIIAEETIDPAELGLTLTQAGRTIKDIDVDISNIKHRDDLRQRVKNADAASEKIGAAQSELDAIKAEKEKFVAAINPKIDAAAAVVASLSAVVGSAHGVVLMLRDSCSDPGLKAQVDLIDQESNELQAEQKRSELCLKENRDQAFHLKLADISNRQNALAARRAEIITLQENQ